MVAMTLIDCHVTTTDYQDVKIKRTHIAWFIGCTKYDLLFFLCLIVLNNLHSFVSITSVGSNHHIVCFHKLLKAHFES